MRTSLRTKIFIGGSVTVVAVVVTCIAAVLYMPRPVVQNSLPATPVQSAQAHAGVPVAISVPSLAVNAPVDPMGIAANGDMESPTVAARTGWYKLGPRPGSVGSAVIAGHFGRWNSGEPSVFDNLHKLRPGDVVTVQDEAGIDAAFIVRETRIFGRDDDATAIFTSTDGKAHLNLITCHGKWDAAKKTYSDRLVVFTDKR